MMRNYRLLAVLLPICGSCVVISKQIDPTSELAEAKVQPEITLLANDSNHPMRGNRIRLLTNITGTAQTGTSET